MTVSTAIAIRFVLLLMMVGWLASVYLMMEVSCIVCAVVS